MEDPVEPIVKIPISGNPQQNRFSFGDIIFSSQFDSGNLSDVIKVDENNVFFTYPSTVK